MILSWILIQIKIHLIDPPKNIIFGPKTINMNVSFLIRMSGSISPISGDKRSFEMRDWAQKRIADYDALP
jgi:hypothetical protein